jgi:hypothetical protein
VTANNTVLHVGTGCPTNSTNFFCRQGNDNAGDVPGRACASNPRASTVVLPGATSRTYFVQVGGYAGDAAVATGLAWDYALASPSAIATRSGTRSRSRALISATRTRKAK